MTHKTTMPEPITTTVLHEGMWIDLDMITTDQAEAYADARVRVALEEAAEVGLNAPHTSGMIDSEDARALSFHVHSRIRSLI